MIALGSLLANITFPLLASLFWLWTILSYLRLSRGYPSYWLLIPCLCACLALSNFFLSVSIAPANRIDIELGRAYSRLSLTASALILAIFTIYYLRDALAAKTPP